MTRAGGLAEGRTFVTGTRSLSLGLGVAALIPFALAGWLVYDSLVLRERPEANGHSAIGKLFVASTVGTPVAGVDQLLPAGMPEASALKRLVADGFACTFETHAATCFRSVAAGRGTDIWTIWLTFDDASKITTSQGERRNARR